MPRTLRPELLDSLAPDDPAARHSRRDLRLINRALGTRGWFQRQLEKHAPRGAAILELGAGEGELLSALRGGGLRVDGLDRWPRPAAIPSAARWHQADLRQFEGWAEYPVVVGNLIFHQFGPAELAELGRKVAGTARLLVAQEPARVRRGRFFLALGGALLGANHVTRHDGPASVDAGFLREELPSALGLGRHGWSWRASITAWGAYRLVAARP